MVETYSGEFICLNCNWRGEIDIPKGKTKNEFAKEKPCPNCGTIKLEVPLL